MALEYNELIVARAFGGPEGEFEYARYREFVTAVNRALTQPNARSITSAEDLNLLYSTYIQTLHAQHIYSPTPFHLLIPPYRASTHPPTAKSYSYLEYYLPPVRGIIHCTCKSCMVVKPQVLGRSVFWTTTYTTGLPPSLLLNSAQPLSVSVLTQYTSQQQQQQHQQQQPYINILPNNSFLHANVTGATQPVLIPRPHFGPQIHGRTQTVEQQQQRQPLILLPPRRVVGSLQAPPPPPPPPTPLPPPLSLLPQPPGQLPAPVVLVQPPPTPTSSQILATAATTLRQLLVHDDIEEIEPPNLIVARSSSTDEAPQSTPPPTKRRGRRPTPGRPLTVASNFRRRSGRTATHSTPAVFGTFPTPLPTTLHATHPHS